MIVEMINKWLFTSNTDLWETPIDLFNKLDSFYHFSIDVCATPENAKCKRYYTKKEDWLKQSWDNEIVWCNPPYWREIWKWVAKWYYAKNSIVVMLLPARTDTSWFHDYIYSPINHTSFIEFIRWRLKFGWSKNSAPFPSMIVIFNSLNYKYD